MQSFKLGQAAVNLEHVLQHKLKPKAGKQKHFNITRASYITLLRMQRGVLTTKRLKEYLFSISRRCNNITIHRAFHQLLTLGYCTRSRYGMAYYYKITAKGIALLCMIEEELENIVNSNEL